MALNFSHRPLFPTHISEENLVSPMRIANGYPFEEKKVEDCFDYGRDYRSGAQESSVHKDILDLLPSDPFGMDISTTFTAITGWLEDLEVDYGGYGTGPVGAGDGNYSLFAAGLNFIWTNAMRFQSFPGHGGFEHKADGVGDTGGSLVVEEAGDSSGIDAVESPSEMGGILGTGNDLMGDSKSAIGPQLVAQGECGEIHVAPSDGDSGALHSAFYFSLGYLNVRDLLLVETVCKSLRSSVRNDTLLWRNIHIDQPLNEKITDDILLELAERAQDAKIFFTLQLSVPGCTKLSIEGIVGSLKLLKTMGAQGVRQLRIGGLYGVTQKHFEELKFLLGMDSQLQQNLRKPHVYHRGNFYLSCEDDRAIDIEMCPRCENLRLIYDCPVENCQGKEHPTKICRACTLCIPRCVQCGRCINDSEYEETFCLECLCSDCLKCQEKHEKKTSYPESSVPHHESCSSSVPLHG
ncbi:hypothetical protein Tsubulata_046517 [Turnera subulata]|uniref:F-box domain-containing protein n=1 Tax=Turnera subulata TaxID=218843 RepID=A0A9Q0GFJ5_9ROSI|nr:hypothetical protein Tsubulata_046517 [Turnera subulata]